MLRKLRSEIAGMSAVELRQLADALLQVGSEAVQAPARPELRRAPLSEVRIFRVRVDVGRAKPPIWRRLELRSDLTLDVVHQVLQAAFGWTDSHLHRFALGGDPFDRDSQLFLCPFDVEEQEPGDDGPAAADVRLDETMQDPGDELFYVYDYGDGWALSLRLEEVLPATADTRLATLIDARRAAPPEDSGGGVDAATLATLLDNPAFVDLDDINEALNAPTLFCTNTTLTGG